MSRNQEKDETVAMDQNPIMLTRIQRGRGGKGEETEEGKEEKSCRILCWEQLEEHLAKIFN